ncbi:hypothetical protein Ccrd_019678 [Cynara cardunculus var. scolymus]|uniref:Uncharacterized protein n=1 Tax=Cynara cardunculus var. scolymus TaxID=59895 RepID=A0A124SF38_CYNCS|nr:hypothetical protein Ccrd_019678 [Cynara cardunculus var. scolymus]
MLDFSSLGTGILSSAYDGRLYTCMHHPETVNRPVAGIGNDSLIFIDIDQGQKLHLWRSDYVESSLPSQISSICSCGFTNGGATSPSWIAVGLSSGRSRIGGKFHGDKWWMKWLLTLASPEGDTGNEFNGLLASSSEEQSEHKNWSSFLASSIVAQTCWPNCVMIDRTDQTNLRVEGQQNKLHRHESPNPTTALQTGSNNSTQCSSSQIMATINKNKYGSDSFLYLSKADNEIMKIPVSRRSNQELIMKRFSLRHPDDAKLRKKKEKKPGNLMNRRMISGGKMNNVVKFEEKKRSIKKP